jgi:ABC-type branched-subunit amino acid transport system substrate-binding protein
VALISPGNSYVGLTRPGPGVGPDDPGRFRLGGGVTYLRVYPGDNIQYEAEAILARELGLKKVYVVIDLPREGYQLTITRGFAEEARRRGIRVVGPASPPSGADGYVGLARSLRDEGVDGVLIATYGSPRVRSLLHALRTVYGADLPIILPDAMLFGDYLSRLGRLGEGIYVSGGKVADPEHQLPPEGRRFVRSFSATQPGRVVNAFTPYTAQATELLLAAIARSDGTRASVLRELRRAVVRNGILGDFSFDENGDMTVNRMPVFRSRPADDPAGPFELFKLYDIRSDED